MTQHPFAALGKGDIFSTPDNPAVPMMKTGTDSAVLLQSYLDNNVLRCRGDLQFFDLGTTVLWPVTYDFVLPRMSTLPESPSMPAEPRDGEPT